MFATSIPPVFKGGYSETERLRRIAKLCHAMAVTFLLRKGEMLGEYFGEELIEEIADKCVAEIIGSRKRNAFGREKGKTKNTLAVSATGEGSIAGLRRLVFESVNREVALVVAARDPGLEEAIRIIRESFTAGGRFRVVERLGEEYLVAGAGEAMEHRPPPGLEELRSLLPESHIGEGTLSETLSKLEKKLMEQTEFSRVVPLLAVAAVCRDSGGADRSDT
jgi:hypothetical protein